MTKIINKDVYIYTTVIGLCNKSIEDIDSKAEIAMFMAQLRQSVGSKAIFMEQGNECIILLMWDLECPNDEVIHDLCLWVSEYKNKCTDLYINMGFDKRTVSKITSLNESIIMARYRMYRSYMDNIPNIELNKEKLHSLMKLFKKILDDLIENTYKNSASDEMMEISTFIDTIMVDYSEKCITGKN